MNNQSLPIQKRFSGETCLRNGAAFSIQSTAKRFVAVTLVLTALIAALVPGLKAADPLALTVSSGYSDLWTGDYFQVSAFLSGGDAYSNTGPITWEVTGAGVSGSASSDGSYYSGTAGGDGGTVTITAKCGTLTTSWDIDIHKLTGLTSTKDVAGYDVTVSFTATQDGGNHPSGPSWSGQVSTTSTDCSTADSTWTSGGVYRAEVTGGDQKFGETVKSIQLELEAFPSDEPAKAGELTGFGVVVNGDLGEPIEYSWSGAVSGSSESPTFTPSTGDTYSGSVDVTVGGFTASSTATLIAVDVQLTIAGGSDDFGFDAVVTPSGQSVTYDLIMGGDVVSFGTLSGSSSIRVPVDYAVAAFNDDRGADPTVQAKKELAERSKNSSAVDYHFNGVVEPYSEFAHRYKKTEAAVGLLWSKNGSLYTTGGISKSDSRTSTHSILPAWTDVATGCALSLVAENQTFTTDISMNGSKLMSGGTIVAFKDVETVAKASFSSYATKTYTHTPDGFSSENDLTITVVVSDQYIVQNPSFPAYREEIPYTPHTEARTYKRTGGTGVGRPSFLIQGHLDVGVTLASSGDLPQDFTSLNDYNTNHGVNSN